MENLIKHFDELQKFAVQKHSEGVKDTLRLIEIFKEESIKESAEYQLALMDVINQIKKIL